MGLCISRTRLHHSIVLLLARFLCISLVRIRFVNLILNLLCIHAHYFLCKIVLVLLLYILGVVLGCILLLLLVLHLKLVLIYSIHYCSLVLLHKYDHLRKTNCLQNIVILRAPGLSLFHLRVSLFLSYLLLSFCIVVVCLPRICLLLFLGFQISSLFVGQNYYFENRMSVCKLVLHRIHRIPRTYLSYRIHLLFLGIGRICLCLVDNHDIVVFLHRNLLHLHKLLHLHLH